MDASIVDVFPLRQVCVNALSDGRVTFCREGGEQLALQFLVFACGVHRAHSPGKCMARTLCPSLRRASTNRRHCVLFPERSHPSNTTKAPLMARSSAQLDCSPYYGSARSQVTYVSPWFHQNIVRAFLTYTRNIFLSRCFRNNKGEFNCSFYINVAIITLIH